MNSKTTFKSKGSLVPAKLVLPLMAMVVLVWAGAGCAGRGVTLRDDGGPGPEKCSDEALKTMRILRLRPDSGALIEIDPFQMGQSPIELTDGPIESFQEEPLAGLPAGTRLYGQIWTGGPEVVIRYYEALPPDGERIPICAVVRWTSDQGKKLPSTSLRVAVIASGRATMWIVHEFR